MVESDGQTGALADGEDSRRGRCHRYRSFPARLALEEDFDIGGRRPRDLVRRLRIDLAVLRVVERRGRTIEKHFGVGQLGREFARRIQSAAGRNHRSDAQPEDRDDLARRYQAGKHARGIHDAE